ncbi:MAG: barstar family protein [Candidatus Pelethousia sp.]|nr:barstar family protein [Candidatus Pelethousia sp.]
MLNILLDGRRFTSKEASHRYLKKKLGRYRYLGFNLDALHDALTSLPACCLRFRHVRALRKNGDGYGLRLFQVFVDAAAEHPGIRLLLH